MVMGLKVMEKKNASGPKKVSLGKKLMFEELDREFSSSPITFFSRFDRLTVQDMSELRRSLEKVSKRSLVVKHTLAKKVLEKIKVPEAARFLEGSMLVTLGAQEPQVVSKTLMEFVKGHENLVLKGLILDGKAYDESYVKELARLPSRKELLAQVAIRMKSPIAGFAMTLRALLQSLVIALSEIQKKKVQAAPPASPAAGPAEASQA